MTDRTSTPLRFTSALNRGWQFARRRIPAKDLPAASVPDVERVDLPHCWNRRDSFQPGISYYRGPGTYWHTVRFPADPLPGTDAVWVLQSEGFYGTGEIWLDEHRLERFDAQYLGFRAEIPGRFVTGDAHRLSVHLTNRCSRHVLPGNPMPDFLLYGGLAGGISMCAHPALHFKDDALILMIEPGDGDAWRVSLGWEIRNDSGQAREWSTRWVIETLDGREIAASDETSRATSRAGASEEGHSALVASRVERWDLANPVIYRLRGMLVEEGRVVDEIERRVGFRTAGFRGEEGFLLNGRRVLLRGCNRHESMPGLGNALPIEQQREDAALLQELGFNFVRLSHYPQHPGFLDACDERGILVFAELASWKSVRGGRWLKNAQRQLRGMIQRDRHHPSVILWGLGNEGRHRKAFLALDGLAKDLDPARATIYAENHLYRARRKKTLGLTDVWGVNYEFDVIPEVAAYCRTGSIVVSECGNEPHTERGDHEAEARQLARMVSEIRLMEQHPAVAGYALWCFNDYATLRKERFRRFSGVVDAWRVPKMAGRAHALLSDSTPRLFLFGEWPAQAAGPREVHVVTNCDRLEWRCGDTGGETRVEGYHAELDLRGRNEDLVVTGWMGDMPTEARLVPHGPAAALTVERFSTALLSRGSGCTLCVRVVDSAGRRVPGWNGMVAVAAEGPVELWAPMPEDQVWVRDGEGRVFCKGGPGPGEAKVRIEAAGLKAGSLAIPVQADGA